VLPPFPAEGAVLAQPPAFPAVRNKLLAALPPDAPTQKPVAALTPLIDVFCPQNGVVLDPFAGSGAARQQNRRFLGFEIG
jgi:DNA modification methylase